MNITEIKAKDKYYSITMESGYEVVKHESLQEAISQVHDDLSLVIQGRIVFDSEENSFINKNKLLKSSEIQKIFSISKQEVLEWTIEGKLPKPINFLNLRLWEASKIGKLCAQEVK